MKKFEFFSDKFHGINLSSDFEHSLNSGESPEMVNFTVTDSYKLKKRKGYSVLSKKDGDGRGIGVATLDGKTSVFYAVGREIFSYYDDDEEKIGEITSDEGEVVFFNFSNKLYVLDGALIMVWDGKTFSEIEPYRPLVSISTTPDGAGVSFEEKNILTGKMRQSFTCGANSITLKLAADNLDSVDYVHVGGKRLSKNNYVADLEKGTVNVTSSAEEMLIPDGVEIGFTKNSGNESLLHKMRRATVFGKENDTRILLYGDSENPDTIRYSGVHGGISGMEYFPENNFNKVGSRTVITSIVRHFDRLMIFAQGQAFYSYMDEAENENGLKYAIFPIRPLSDAVGCSSCGFAALCNSFPITLDHNTLYRWASSNIRDERYAVNIGEKIRRGIEKWQGNRIRSFDSEKTGELFIYSDMGCYVYSYVLDVFYYWNGFSARGFCEFENSRILFQRSDGSLCALFESDLDAGEAVSAVWCSPYLSFADGVKNLEYIDLETYPDVDAGADIYWVSNHGQRGLKSFFKKVSRFTFEKMSFKNFGFQTSVSPYRMSARVRHKRFEKMKIRIENSYPNSPLHILSLRVRGVVTDKK